VWSRASVLGPTVRRRIGVALHPAARQQRGGRIHPGFSARAVRVGRGVISHCFVLFLWTKTNVGVLGKLGWLGGQSYVQPVGRFVSLVRTTGATGCWFSRFCALSHGRKQVPSAASQMAFPARRILRLQEQCAGAVV